MWQNASGASSEGVGLLLSKTTESALTEIKSYNERIIIAHFNGNPLTTVIVHYSPTKGSETAEDHYNNLTNTIKSIPKHNVLLVVGDCNAHIGKEAKFTYHQVTNTNRKLLLDLAEENHLIITNTIFQKRLGKLWTYISDMNGTKSQIDYILINRKWKNSLRNVESYSSFSSIGSDYRIVSAKLKLCLRRSKTPPRKAAYDWKVLRGDGNLLNRYEQLCIESQSDGNDSSKTYENLIHANSKAAK